MTFKAPHVPGQLISADSVAVAPAVVLFFTEKPVISGPATGWSAYVAAPEKSVIPASVVSAFRLTVVLAIRALLFTSAPYT